MMYLQNVMPGYVMALHYNNIAFIKKGDEQSEFVEPTLEELLDMDFTAYDILRLVINVFKEMQENAKNTYLISEYQFTITDYEVPDENDPEKKIVKHKYTFIEDKWTVFDLEQEDYEALKGYILDETNARNAQKALGDFMILSEAWQDPDLVEDNPEDVADVFDILLYVDTGNGDRVAYLRK